MNDNYYMLFCICREHALDLTAKHNPVLLIKLKVVSKTPIIMPQSIITLHRRSKRVSISFSFFGWRLYLHNWQRAS